MKDKQSEAVNRSKEGRLQSFFGDFPSGRSSVGQTDEHSFHWRSTRQSIWPVASDTRFWNRSQECSSESFPNLKVDVNYSSLKPSFLLVGFFPIFFVYLYFFLFLKFLHMRLTFLGVRFLFIDNRKKLEVSSNRKPFLIRFITLFSENYIFEFM